jgi:hypothetical protein
MFVQPHFNLVDYQPGENFFFGEEWPLLGVQLYTYRLQWQVSI